MVGNTSAAIGFSGTASSTSTLDPQRPARYAAARQLGAIVQGAVRRDALYQLTVPATTTVGVLSSGLNT